jgi:sporulation integral membrane protein YtvI
MPEQSHENPLLRSRQFKIGVLVVAGLLFLVGAAWLRSVTTPILVALIIAYVLDPLVLRLEKLRLPRWGAVTLVYVCFLGALAGTLLAVVPPVVRQAQKLPGYVEELSKQFSNPDKEESDVDTTPKAENPPESLTDRLKESLRENADEVADRTVAFLRQALEQAVVTIRDVISILLQTALVFIFTFFFLLGLHPFYKRVRRHLPGRYRDEILRVTQRLDQSYSNFFRGRLTICVTSGVLTSVGLLIVGIPFWLLIGMMVGVLGIIPFVGVMLGLIPALTMGFLIGGWQMALGVAIVFAVVQSLEPLLTPIVLSRGMRLHPVTILIGLLVGGRLFGLFGAVISVPLVSTVKILSEEFLLPPLRELAEEEPAD